jgi:hypothetical protein
LPSSASPCNPDDLRRRAGAGKTILLIASLAGAGVDPPSTFKNGLTLDPIIYVK